MPKQRKKKEIVEIEEKTVFEFTKYQNAYNVAMALCQGGYFVRITATGTGYVVYVYKHYYKPQ